MVAAPPPLAEQLLSTVRWAVRQGWCAATGGNFSARIDRDRLLITPSGCDKATVQMEDLVVCGIEDGHSLEAEKRPSAEAVLHAALYRIDTDIAAVFHGHSRAATVLSRHQPGQALTLTGYEMQKALDGNESHDSTMKIAIFDNSQDMRALAQAVTERWSVIDQPALLVRGHGLYAWGRDLTAARRHLEGLEFLFDCSLKEHLLQASSCVPS